MNEHAVSSRIGKLNDLIKNTEQLLQRQKQLKSSIETGKPNERANLLDRIIDQTQQLHHTVSRLETPSDGKERSSSGTSSIRNPELKEQLQVALKRKQRSNEENKTERNTQETSEEKDNEKRESSLGPQLKRALKERRKKAMELTREEVQELERRLKEESSGLPAPCGEKSEHLIALRMQMKRALQKRRKAVETS